MHPLFKYLLIILFSFTLIACSSGGGGGGDSTLSIPDDATTITTANASTVARSAVDNVVLFGAISDLRPQEETLPSTGDVIGLVIDRAFDRNRQTASRTETVECDSGTFTLDYDETETSASGSVSYNNCDFGGATINGSFTFNSTFDDTTGAYSDSGNGSLTISSGGESATIGLDYEETGNDFSGEFSVDYTMSISGTPDANFLLTTTTPITGVNFDVTGGEILVEGAADTRLKITVTGVNVADVFFDDGNGTFVFFETITF